MKHNENVTTIFALGGLGEVGKNMYVVEHDNEIIIIDAGILFPENDLLGIDYVIQDITYLRNKENIKALFITHGHEDHIGGVSFLLQNVNIPVIYTPITTDLIKNKFADRNINYKNVEVYNKDSIFKFKILRLNLWELPTLFQMFGIIIRTPNGTIFNNRDFKFDLTQSDLWLIFINGRFSKEGVKIYYQTVLMH